MTNDAADEAAHKAANEATNQAANGATTEAANRAANKAVNETATAEASEATIEASNEAAKHGGQPSSEPGSQRGNGEGVFAGHPFFGCPLSRRVASGPDFCRSRRVYQSRPRGPVPPARAARRPPRPTMPGAPLSADEIRLSQVWYTNNMAPSTIAENLHRDKSTITRLIKDNFQKKTAGRKNMLSDAQVDNLISHLERLIKKANGEYEVTWHMLKTSSRCKASEATIARRLHEKGYRFYGMRHKPLLTDQDIQDRFEFGETYQGKPASWWQSHVHMHIDVKFFPVLLTGKARRHVAQSGTRGVIRRPGEGLNAGYVKPNPKLKYNTGAKGVHILAGVGNGKVLLWEEVQGNWNSSEAARIYEGPMLKALKAAYPGTKRFRVLEDNDPSGFKASKGVAAKERAGIRAFEIPAHSPQLNVCDYWLWREVNKRMRARERTFPSGKRETRVAFIRRLKRTAMSIPSDVITKSIGSMKKRCQLLVQAEGGQIEG